MLKTLDTIDDIASLPEIVKSSKISKLPYDKYRAVVFYNAPALVGQKRLTDEQDKKNDCVKTGTTCRSKEKK